MNLLALSRSEDLVDSAGRIIGAANGPEALFIVDDTSAQARIRSDLKRMALATAAPD
mgnify:CR=1 FL=1